jgi:hypothetical protein
MPRQRISCPCCERPFRKILDYPYVRVLSFERLPVPEAVDTMSEAAAEKWLARRRKAAADDLSGVREDGINMTPAIEKTCRSDSVVDYFLRLSNLVGQTVQPTQLAPPGPVHRRFKWAYPIAGTSLYLSLDEADDTAPHETVAEVQIHCAGPNLGSAGGPTLQLLGPIARLGYQGLLADGTPPPHPPGSS